MDIRLVALVLVHILLVCVYAKRQMPTFRYTTGFKETQTEPSINKTTNATVMPLPVINTTVTWTLIEENNTSDVVLTMPEAEPEHVSTTNNGADMTSSTVPEPEPEASPVKATAKATTVAPLATTPGFSTSTSFWDLVFSYITTQFPGNKDGKCPDASTVRRSCQSRCHHDYDCMYDRKCCHDGHGFGCCSDLMKPTPFLGFFDRFFDIPISHLRSMSAWMS